VAQADSDGQGNTVGWWLKPAVLSKAKPPVCGSSRLCWSSHHYWLVAQAGSVEQANTVGGGSSQLCWLSHHCWLVV
jgi:hypothetical protein